MGALDGNLLKNLLMLSAPHWCDLLHLLGGLLHVRQQGKMATVIQGAIILDQDGQRVGIRINASIVELQLGANSKSIDTGTLNTAFKCVR